MKIHNITTFLASALLFEFADGATFLNQGTYVEDFAEPCLDVIAANEFYGDCCSFSDIDENGNKCRLMVAGPNSSCGWNNKQYMEECAQAGACVAGPQVTVMYEADGIVEECPESEYDWQMTNTPDCVQTTTPFDAGWGTCDTYAEESNHNHDYCEEDHDNNGLYAHQACAECGQCKDPKPTDATCPPETPFDHPTCEGNVRCEYGEETCCGETHTEVICECFGGEFACYYTDACLHPQC